MIDASSTVRQGSDDHGDESKHDDNEDSVSFRELNALVTATTSLIFGQFGGHGGNKNERESPGGWHGGGGSDREEGHHN